MCAPSSQRSEAGFSLLEVIISLAILAVALGAVFSAGTFGLRASARASERTEALMEARSLIDRIGVDVPLTAGVHNGTTALGRTYHLTISPSATKTASPLRAYEIAADIAARDGKAPIVSLRTLRTAKATQ